MTNELVHTGRIRIAITRSSLGRVLVAQSDRGIAGVLLGDDAAALRAEARRRVPAATLVEADDETHALAAAVVAAIETPALAGDLPLDLRGTSFQQTVWQALRAIPRGSTASYTEIATRIGAPTAARAVAQACAANAVAVLVPCHRVVRRDGALAGYRWGVERKRALLEREAGTSA